MNGKDTRCAVRYRPFKRPLAANKQYFHQLNQKTRLEAFTRRELLHQSGPFHNLWLGLVQQDKSLVQHIPQTIKCPHPQLSNPFLAVPDWQSDDFWLTTNYFSLLFLLLCTFQILSSISLCWGLISSKSIPQTKRIGQSPIKKKLVIIVITPMNIFIKIIMVICIKY